VLHPVCLSVRPSHASIYSKSENHRKFKFGEDITMDTVEQLYYALYRSKVTGNENV